jgi:hypothetical protein
MYYDDEGMIVVVCSGDRDGGCRNDDDISDG